jgi:hypothetical protein
MDQRCFIIGTGPSLTFEDLEKLKNEKTFAVNSIVSVYDKISYKPTFYGIQDGYVFNKLKEKIYECKFPNVFWGREYINQKYVQKSWIEYPFTCAFTSRSPLRKKNKFPSKFSDDCSVVVYDGYSVVYSMLQIAIFLGFKEIYLLGCDCNYKKDIKNFTDHGLRNIDGIAHGMISAYREARKYADRHNNLKIYNATRGGMLEVFERVDLDNILVD